MKQMYNRREYTTSGGREITRTRKTSKVRRNGASLKQNLLKLITFLLILVFIFPFTWMVLTSLKDSIAVFKDAFPLTWKTFIPEQPTLSNYRTVFGETYQFGKNILNSVIVAVGQVITTTIVCSLAAFVFARLEFRGRDLLFAFVMLTAFIPIEVIMVPLYSVMRVLDLTSSYFALFLPFSFSPLGVFLLRQAFMDIPKVYDEAAYLDGASTFQTYWHIIMPNAWPALITQALVQFIWSWNNFLWPLVVMQDPNKKIAQVAIAAFAEAGSNRPLWGEAFAAATIATLPVLIFFFFMQRYYVQGVLISGMK